MTWVLKCDCCGRVDEERSGDLFSNKDKCRACEKISHEIYDSVKKELIERYSALGKCVMSCGMAFISTERSHPGHLRSSFGDEVGDWMEIAVKEYEDEE